MKKLSLFFSFLMPALGVFAQDKLVGYDNAITPAKIVEINDTTIKYKAWDNLEGPLYNVSKSNFAVIIFQNGKVEVIHQKPKTFEEIRNQLRVERKQNIRFRNSIGFDVFSLIPGFSSFGLFDGSLSSLGMSYERRSKKQLMAHKVNFYVQYVGETKGTFYLSYQPKVFFNKHKYVRGFIGLEGGLGLAHYSGYNNNYDYYPAYNDLRIHVAPVVGINFYPTERMHIVFDYTMGGQFTVLKPIDNYSIPFFYRIGSTIGYNF